jgi:hypothetical protein
LKKTLYYCKIKEELNAPFIPTKEYTYSQDIEQTFTRREKVILPRHGRFKTNGEDWKKTSSLSLKKAKH